MTELATSVGVALVVTLLALWAAGPAAACVIPAIWRSSHSDASLSLKALKLAGK
jgi:hypothetical protein